MIENLINSLSDLPREVIVFIIATLPVSELRGSIPVAATMNISPLKAYIISVIGNMAPVIPMLFLLEPVSERLRRFRLWHSFFEWLFARTRKKADLVQKYEALGLILFVAIPLPVTGAWTGCVAATLFKIKFRYAFFSILAGVMIAGIIVTVLTLFGASFFK
jgi:uncharacterized membrane protein